MLRMAHRILASTGRSFAFEPNSKAAALYDESKSAVQRSHVIVADDIAEYFRGNWHKDHSDRDGRYMPSDFGVCRPVFDDLFIEYTTSDENCNATGIEQFGIQIWRNIDDSTFGAMIWFSSHGEPLFVPGVAEIGFDSNGVLTGSAFVPAGNVGQSTESMMAPLGPALLAMAFMNCKNVQRRDATEELAPSAKWIRRQKAPQIRYHVLDINPMKEVLRKEGGIESNGLKKALHICRGHFATYTEDKPLFGHVTGTFWKPAHVRGQAEQGIVLKDYRVKMPT